jgi:hypothetical protein
MVAGRDECACATTEFTAMELRVEKTVNRREFKMPTPKVTKLNVKQKVNPIVREHDNTTDLEIAEQRVHAKYKGLKAPKNIDPGNNGTVTTTG